MDKMIENFDRYSSIFEIAGHDDIFYFNSGVFFLKMYKSGHDEIYNRDSGIHNEIEID